MQEEHKPRVLITFVEAGGGHIVSAQAIAESLKARYGDRMDIIESHILRDSDNPILPKYEGFLVRNTQWYSKLPAYGDIQFASMHILGAQNTLKLIHNTIFYTQTKATIEEYTKYRPDVIICTHYFLLYTAVEYKRKYDRNVIIVAYCPDNNVHGWWDNRADVIYTNNPIATKQAYDLRFPNGHVVETAFPTRADVSESNESKEYYRKKFGIPADKFAVVIADGVYAKAKARRVCNELLKTDYPLTVCVLAGKNDRLKRELDAKKDKVKPNITLLTFGFLKDAPQLYGACDLFITKGGPNAVLDSVMMGTPIIIDYCASPIERTTQELFTERYFCGYHFVSPRRIRKQVETLIEKPELLEGIRSTLSFFDKSKNGAEEIADDIAELIWNGDDRMDSKLREEAEAISELMDEKVAEQHAKAEEKIEKVNEAAARRADTLEDDEDFDRLNEQTARRIEDIRTRTEEKIERLNEKAEKITQGVYSGTSSKYASMAAERRIPEKTEKR